MLALLRCMVLVGSLFSPSFVAAQSESDLEDQNKRLLQQLEATRTVVTVLDARAAEAERERERLREQLRRIRERNIVLQSELDALSKKADQSGSTNQQLRAEMERLQQSHRQQVADLESRVKALQDERDQPEPASEQEASGFDNLNYRSGWIAQLLGYHRGYLDAARNVEISASDEQERRTLSDEIKKTIRRDFDVPDLSSFGVPLVGGNVTSINGVATGRLLYRDSEGNPLEFWLVRREGRRSQVYFGENDDLNIVHWAGNDAEYALIGKAGWSELAPVVGELYQRYGM